MADGFLVLDKPGGMTSRTALDRVLRSFPRGTRMGHAGTLDPLATGVLVLAIGTSTRLVEYVQHMSKIYRTTLRLGARSDTDDADGTVTPVADAVVPDEALVRTRVAEFVGEIEQVPPAFSAAKISGRRAYDMARGGEQVVLEAKRVVVYRIDLLRYAYPELELEIQCGKGTYIRSLARDLGARLGCGAYVEVLRRTAIGPYRVEDAVTLETEPAAIVSRVLGPETAMAELPRAVLKQREIQALAQGREIFDVLVAGARLDVTEVAVFDEAERLRAIGLCDVRGRRMRPLKML